MAKGSDTSFFNLVMSYSLYYKLNFSWLRNSRIIIILLGEFELMILTIQYKYTDGCRLTYAEVNISWSKCHIFF